MRLDDNSRFPPNDEQDSYPMTVSTPCSNASNLKPVLRMAIQEPVCSMGVCSRSSRPLLESLFMSIFTIKRAIHEKWK